MSQLFASGGQSIAVSASTSVLPMNTQDWSPCSPRDSQESSPTPQFKSINSSVLSFHYSPTLMSTHDYWKNHSLATFWSIFKNWFLGKDAATGRILTIWWRSGCENSCHIPDNKCEGHASESRSGGTKITKVESPHRDACSQEENLQFWSNPQATMSLRKRPTVRCSSRYRGELGFRRDHVKGVHAEELLSRP